MSKTVNSAKLLEGAEGSARFAALDHRLNSRHHSASAISGPRALSIDLAW
jgi:hypothetical protein